MEKRGEIKEGVTPEPARPAGNPDAYSRRKSIVDRDTRFDDDAVKQAADRLAKRIVVLPPKD